MRLSEILTDEGAIREIGARLERIRISRELTQVDLARNAGVGRATIQRIESGESVQLMTLVKVLRTLGMLDNLDIAIPERVVSPIQQLHQQRANRPRQRVRNAARKDDSRETPWAWGDDAPRS